MPQLSGDLHVRNFPVVMEVPALSRRHSVGIFRLKFSFRFCLFTTFVTHINIKQLFHLIGQSREYSMRKSENSTEISNCTHKLLNMHLDTRRNLDCHPYVFALRCKAVARKLKLFHLVKDKWHAINGVF